MSFRKLTAFSILLITVGIICLFLENTFYGTVAEDGRLQESFFLPLGMMTLLSGIALAVVLGVLRLLFSITNKKSR